MHFRQEKEGNSANCFSFQNAKTKFAKKNSPPDNHQFNLELWFEQKVVEMGTMAKNVVRLNAPAELYTVYPQIVSSLEWFLQHLLHKSKVIAETI